MDVCLKYCLKWSVCSLFSLLPPNGDRCPERDFHTATHVERKVIVFGGRCKFE